MPVQTVYRLQTTVVEENVRWSCCVCGKEAEPNGHPHWRPSGFHLIELHGGYADKFPPDSSTLKIVACEDCLKAWVATFKHPDVVLSGWLDATHKVRHSETGDWMQVRMGWWVWPLGQEDPPPTSPEETGEEPEWPFPESNALWEHYKGNHYMTVAVAFMYPDRTPMVVYRALYGDSELWVRPASMWEESVEHDGGTVPRFKYLGRIPNK